MERRVEAGIPRVSDYWIEPIASIGGHYVGFEKICMLSYRPRL